MFSWLLAPSLEVFTSLEVVVCPEVIANLLETDWSCLRFDSRSKSESSEPGLSHIQTNCLGHDKVEYPHLILYHPLVNSGGQRNELNITPHAKQVIIGNMDCRDVGLPVNEVVMGITVPGAPWFQHPQNSIQFPTFSIPNDIIGKWWLTLRFATVWDSKMHSKVAKSWFWA